MRGCGCVQREAGVDFPPVRDERADVEYEEWEKERAIRLSPAPTNSLFGLQAATEDNGIHAIKAQWKPYLHQGGRLKVSILGSVGPVGTLVPKL